LVHVVLDEESISLHLHLELVLLEGGYLVVPRMVLDWLTFKEVLNEVVDLLGYDGLTAFGAAMLRAECLD